jgi:oligopeptide transport system substrate-binding protein
VTKPPLDDVRVRQALSMTVNRKAVAEGLLKAGQSSLYTLVPWGKIGAYESPEREEVDTDTTFDNESARQTAQKARKLLAEAGYGPRGKPFPPIEIHYNTSESHRDIAEVIAQGWKIALGIEVRFVNQEWKVWLDSQQNLEYQISRSSWIADYPDAYSFLNVFESDNPNNRTGWKNARYDSLLSQAAGEPLIQKRVQLLREAETILLDQAPILPIYSYVTQNLVNPRLGGFHSNQLNEQYPKYWYWKSDAELSEVRAELPKNLVRSEAPGPRAGLYSPAALRERAAAK